MVDDRSNDDMADGASVSKEEHFGIQHRLCRICEDYIEASHRGNVDKAVVARKEKVLVLKENKTLQLKLTI